MGIPVKLEVFEGPLDLLLHLIEKNKVDIYDIPIVEITEQYLEYMNHLLQEYEANISQLLDTLRDKRIVIFGCGNWGTELQDLLARNGIRIDAFCDNSLDKQGKEINGVLVKSLSNVLESIENAFFVVASALYSKNICQQLTEHRINTERIFVYKHNKYLWD